MPFYFTAANDTSLSFLKFSDAYLIEKASLLIAVRTISLSFYIFFDVYYSNLPFIFTTANDTSLSFLKFSDMY